MVNPENIGQQFTGTLFHVSQKSNRKGIEARGIQPSLNEYDRLNETTGNYEPVSRFGIYLTESPSHNYGHDIWAVNTAKNNIVSSDLDNSHQKYKTDYFLGRGVSDVKRVGHFYQNPNGHPEVHWHKEEDCPDGSQ